eukprot:COSAG01_NODE_2100_length_8429_cov_29.066507_8_plen_73_part_00
MAAMNPLMDALESDPTSKKEVVTFVWPDCTALDFFGALFSDTSDFQVCDFGRSTSLMSPLRLSGALLAAHRR